MFKSGNRPRGSTPIAQVTVFADSWYRSPEAVQRVDRHSNPDVMSRSAADERAARMKRSFTIAVGPTGMLAYLAYMAERLLESYRLLKLTGSIYLHCNATASHYLRSLMDGLFRSKNAVSEIAWNYNTPSRGRAGGKKPVKASDNLLFYKKTR